MDNYPSTIKAEVLINLDHAVNPDLLEHQVFYVSDFRKKHQGDIMKVETASKGEKRRINTYFVNRDGFYDRLPEGLFHGRRSEKRMPNQQGGSRDAYDTKEKERAWSRKFFQPFENFLFAINVKAEKLISHWHKNADSALGDFFLHDIRFQQISEPFRQKIFSMLACFPYIRGDYKRVAFFLAAIFEAEVIVSRKEGFEVFHANDDEPMNHLGQTTLGVDTVCGDRTMEHVQKWKFYIKTSPDKLAQNINQKETQNIYDIIKSFFVPVGIMTEFVVVAAEMSKLTLLCDSSDGNNQYLGYNTSV